MKPTDKELKYDVGLASIHSKKQDLVLQEIFSKLIMYNFAALISLYDRWLITSSAFGMVKS